MPYYDHKCETCGRKEEICCSSVQWERMRPVCCGVPMARDYQAEHFGGLLGRGYPFVDDGITGTPIEVRDYAHHKRLLRENNMSWHEPRSETKYRRRHIKDLTGGGR